MDEEGGNGELRQQGEWRHNYLELSMRKVAKVRAVEAQQMTDQTVNHSSANSLSSLNIEWL
jgi:hypothetical protein